MAEPMTEPTMLDEDEEILGDPSFQMWVRDGEPIVSGSYFMHPPLRAKSAQWDPRTCPGACSSARRTAPCGRPRTCGRPAASLRTCIRWTSKRRPLEFICSYGV